MDQKDFVYIAAGVGLVCVLAIVAILASGKKSVYKRSGQMLLVNEQKFLTAVLQAIPADTLLTFKVRLLNIVNSRSATTGKSLDNELRDYFVDFVLVDRNTSEVKLCIEMLMEGRDSKTGNVLIGRALRRAGIPHIKLPLVRFYDPVRLRQIIVTALKEGTI